MPPPPRKKRKTAASMSGISGLSLELISHVASFANFGSDVLNICLAVGPKDANAIRRTCLRNNMRYLKYRIEQYVDEEITSDQITAYAKAWMSVNADWRKHCTDENRKEYAIVQWEKSENEESDNEEEEEEEDEDSFDDGIRFKTDGAAIFNNPLVAIEFGLVDPLKHLVEEVGIDINCHAWNTYSEMDKSNLLTFAAQETSLACFQYLLTREDLNVDGKSTTYDDGAAANHIMNFAFEDELVSLDSFEAMASHSSFDVNNPLKTGSGDMIFLLQYACSSIAHNLNETDVDLDKREEKFMSLLNKFKAHPSARTLDCGRPAIDIAYKYRNKDPRMDRIYWAMEEVLSKHWGEEWQWAGPIA